jgi:hypothetical protein
MRKARFTHHIRNRDGVNAMGAEQAAGRHQNGIAMGDKLLG